jgi:hypothetical protein
VREVTQEERDYDKLMRELNPDFVPGVRETPQDRTFTAVQPFPPFARLPLIPWDQDTRPSTPMQSLPDYKDLEGIDETDPHTYYRPESTRTAFRRSQLARIRVLDYNPFFSQLCSRKFRETALRIDVLRRRRPLHSDHRASTVVDFLNLTSPRCLRTGQVPWACFSAPSGTRRYILHLTFDPSHPELGQGLVYADLVAVRKLVVVFTPQLIAPRPGRTIGPEHEDLPRLGLLDSIMRSVAHTMWAVRPGTTVELVGLERVPATFLNLDPALTGKELLAAVAAAMRDWADEWVESVEGADDKFRQELDARSRAPIKLTTMEEWRTSVSDVVLAPCPALPGVDEDKRDQEEWANEEGMDSGSHLHAEWNERRGAFDYFPHAPWQNRVEQQELSE